LADLERLLVPSGEDTQIGRKSLPRIAFAPTDVLEPRFDRVQRRGDLIELGVMNI